MPKDPNRPRLVLQGQFAADPRAKSHSSQVIQIAPGLLEQFGRSTRENFTSGSIPFRKAHLQSLIEVIEVDDTQIRIKGNKDVLERAVLASRNGATPGSQMSTEWRAISRAKQSSSAPQLFAPCGRCATKVSRDID